MKTHLIFLSFTSLLITSTFSQDFIGYRNGNYTGVNGVFFNPANIGDSRYKFDVNLLSLSTNVSNNKASFSLKNLSTSFNKDSISNQIFGANAGKSSGFASIDVHGPSLMFNTGPKMAFAVTSRARVMANVTDMDGKLVNRIINNFTNDATLPYNISSAANMRFNINAWSEYGVSIARVIRDDSKHFFKGGITLKYLAGASNSYLNIGNFNGTLNQDLQKQDNYLSNTAGRIATGFGGLRISDFEPDQLTKMESSGFGADIGFVYELRPDYQKYKNEEKSSWKREMNKYKLKVGVALLDIGRIKYEKDLKRSGAYNMNITGNNRFYLGELNNIDIDNYRFFFNARPQYFIPDNSNAESTYIVSLPSTIQLDIDYHFYKGLYASLATQMSLVNSDNKSFNSRYYNGFTLTPRYEGKAVGFYLPVSYNSLTKVIAGASLRLGPLFIGSGSVLTALLGNSKQADLFLGLRFGALHR